MCGILPAMLFLIDYKKYSVEAGWFVVPGGPGPFVRVCAENTVFAFGR
jgi:hypothetical protein